jgi:preprotein translocase subunit SecG
MGAVFGGGASSTVFGSRGAGNFLTLLTKICATIFMLTSLSLSYLLTEQAGERLFDGEIETSEQAPFEDLGTVMPEEANAEAPPTDPMEATGDDAALDEFIEEDANKADATP